MFKMHLQLMNDNERGLLSAHSNEDVDDSVFILDSDSECTLGKVSLFFWMILGFSFFPT